MKKRFVRPEYINAHASIESRPNFDAAIGGISYTANREDGFGVAIETSSSNATDLSLQLGVVGVQLSGRQARTLQRLLNKHYENCGVPSILGAE